MTLVSTTGLWLPERITNGAAITGSVLGPIVATGDKIAFCGRVWTPNRGSKNITKVGFRFGTVTKTGGSGLTVSLQAVDLVNGPPIRPDGTPAQTVAVVASAVTSNTWLQTGALNATRTVAHGDRLAVVIEYDGGGRLGSDSYAISALAQSTSFNGLESSCVTNLSTVWAAVSASSLAVLLEFDDGTFGTLDTGFFFSAVGNDSLTSGGTAIVGMQFQVPFACKVDGGWALIQAAASADFNFKLFSVSGTALTLMATSAEDANASRAAATIAFSETIFAEQTLSANTTYFMAIEAITANAVTLYNYSVSAAGHFGAQFGGTTWQYNTATGTTLGTATATKRPVMGLRISAVDDGNGSGGAASARMIGG